MQRLFLVARLLAPFLYAVACIHAAETPPAPPSFRPLSERVPLKLGTKNDSYPNSYIDDDGRWAGFAVDLIQSVARVMDLKFEPIIANDKDTQAAFRQGHFDLLHAFSQTPSRDTYADFSVPYLTLQGAVFVRENSPIQTIADLEHKRFAIIGLDSIGDKFIRDRNLEVQRILVSSTSEALRLIEEGRCDATFASNLTALSVIERNQFDHIRQLGAPLPNYDIRHCFAVHKGDAQLLARLNEGLALLNRTGEYQRIYEKWFGRFSAPVFTREQLTSYLTSILAVALLLSLLAFWRQHRLRRALARQTRALAEKEALLRALFDNLPTAILVLEGNPSAPRLVSLNRHAERFLNLPAGAHEGHALHTLPIEASLQATLLHLCTLWPRSGTLHQEEKQLATPSRCIDFVLIPLSAAAPAQPRLCIIAEDISKRRHQDEELAQSRRLRALGELVGGIAHEFNNLLTPVMLKLGEIRLDWANDRKLLSEIDVIHGVVDRTAELTRRLLAFGRRSDLSAGPVQLATLVASAAELIRMTIDRRIQIVNKTSTALPPLPINATDLHQIILNLLINARDTLTEKLAQPPADWSPRITLSLSQYQRAAPDGSTQHWQRFSIEDNGKGMPAAIRERIFEPFFTTKEVGRGTGLGLATVWHFVTENKGRIEVESTAGTGTTFHLHFPSPAQADKPLDVPLKPLS